MTYLYCSDCGNIFPEEDSATVNVEWGYGTKPVCACPDCKSTYVEEAGTCEVCGRPILPDQHVCIECAVELYKAWNAAVETVMDLRLKSGFNLSADFVDCEDGFMEYLRETGRVL